MGKNYRGFDRKLGGCKRPPIDVLFTSHCTDDQKLIFISIPAVVETPILIMVLIIVAVNNDKGPRKYYNDVENSCVYNDLIAKMDSDIENHKIRHIAIAPAWERGLKCKDRQYYNCGKENNIWML